MKRAKAGGGGEPKIGVCGFPKAAIAEGESISAGRFSKGTNAEGKSTEGKGGNPGSWKPVEQKTIYQRQNPRMIISEKTRKNLIVFVSYHYNVRFP